MPIDERIQTALETEAAQVPVPADEIRERIRRSGARLRPAAPRLRWRLGRRLELAAAGLIMVGLVALAVARGPAGVAPGDGQGLPPSRGPAGAPGQAGNEGSLNPQVAAPEPRVIVPPDLPAVTPPDGLLSQQEALHHGVAAAEKRVEGTGGQLTLVDMKVAGDRWVLAFRGDGRAIAFGGGPRPQSPLTDFSRVRLLGAFTLELDGRTGEVYSTRETGMRADPTRADLEHYRGRIVGGGAGLTLRLVNADGTREGQDLTVWAPQEAISAGGLAYWQLVYGTGRTLDVWGLTSAEGQVVAHRLAMPDPPLDESLTELELVHGVPVYPQARATEEKRQSGADFFVEGAGWQAVRDWYLEQMPRYGWVPMPGEDPPPGGVAVSRFRSDAWTWAEIRLEPAPKGIHLILTLGDEAAAQPEPT